MSTGVASHRWDPDVHFVIGAYPPSVGGAQVHTQRLAQELERAHSLTMRVSCLWRESRADWLLGSTSRLPVGTRIDTAGPIEIHTVGWRQPLTTGQRLLIPVYLPMRRRTAEAFARLLDYRQGAAKIVHLVRVGREHLALRAFRDARASRRPVLLTPNHHPRWSTRPDPAWRYLYRSVDHVIALTEYEKRSLVDLGVPEERVSVTGIGPTLSETPVDVNDLRTRFGLGDHRFVLFLGQQFRYKRVPIAIAAFDELAARDPDIHLVIAGPTAKATMKTAIRSRHSERIHVVGVVDIHTKTTLIAEAASLIFPSTQESFGGVLIEAASVGTPFVASDIPQLREVLGRIGGGTCVEPDSSSFAEALEATLAASSNSSQPNASVIENEFSWRALADKYVRIYESLSN